VVPRGRGLPLAAQLCLALTVVGLGGAVLWLSTGALGRVAADLGSSLGD